MGRNCKAKGDYMKMKIKAIPLDLKSAQNYINQNHRHHIAAHRDKFRIGAEIDGKLVGVVQVGRPLSRYLDDGKTLEVLRLCSDGSKNVCSFLYSRAARVAKELGYEKIITYTLDYETGASLKASGWNVDAENVGGLNWNTPSRPRDIQPQQLSWDEKNIPKYPQCKKNRWAKILK